MTTRLSYEQQVVLDFLYSETGNSPTKASTIFEECFGERISIKMVFKYWRSQNFPPNPMGGAREVLSDHRMNQIYNEFRDSDGRLDILRTSSIVRRRHSLDRLVDKCEKLGLPYYNVPRNNGNRTNRTEQNGRGLEPMSSFGKRRFSGIGNH